MALGGIELETLVSEPDALTTRPPFTSACLQTYFLTDSNEMFYEQSNFNLKFPTIQRLTITLYKY